MLLTAYQPTSIRFTPQKGSKTKVYTRRCDCLVEVCSVPNPPRQRSELLLSQHPESQWKGGQGTRNTSTDEPRKSTKGSGFRLQTNSSHPIPPCDSKLPPSHRHALLSTSFNQESEFNKLRSQDYDRNL